MTHWWNCFGHHETSDTSDNDFDFPEATNLVGLWDFNDGAKTHDTGLADGIAQNGHTHGNASISNGALHLDGNGDYFDVSGTDGPFDLDQGTIMVEFTQTAHVSTSPDTLVNRGEYNDRATEGYFGIQVTADGRVQVQHMDGSNSVTLSTGANFFSPGDDVRVAYSFDVTSGGSFVVENLSTGSSYNVDHHVTGLSMEIGDNDDENFTFGAREVDDGQYDHFFNGDINYVACFNDDLIKGESDGIVSGTAGNDLIDLNYTGDPEHDMVDAGDAILEGAAPNDDVIEAGTGNDTVWAGKGDDLVYGGQGDDKLYGESGNDTLYGGDGNDSVRGGDGNDVINTAGSNAKSDYGYPGLVPQDSDPNNDRDFADGGAGDDWIFTGDDRDTITGGAGNDTLDGGLDDDQIDGGEGDDLIIGGHGSDLIDGGAGNDTIYGGTTIPELNIPDENNGAYNDLRPDNARDTIHGGSGNDWIDGEDDADLLYGDDGDDTILGGIDNDTIYGGAGNDSLVGGDGADDIYGDDGNDLIDLGGDVTAEYADHASGGADRDTFVGGGAGDVVVGGETGDDYDTLNLTGLGPLRVVYTGGDPTSESGTVEFLDGPGGAVTGTLTFSEIENVIPCFTPGTLIATPRGERLVQDLQPGDKVITRDNGIQEIRWIGAKKLDWKGLALSPHLKPILVRAGSLGNGLPERDMMVSPNHRVLVANDRTALYFEEREVLAAAKHLVNNRGIHEVEVMGATYIHFMFDNHEVVLSNGAWTESFQPGDYTLEGIGNSQRSEILDLFPELETTEGREAYQSARRTLKKHEARLLID